LPTGSRRRSTSGGLIPALEADGLRAQEPEPVALTSDRHVRGEARGGSLRV